MAKKLLPLPLDQPNRRTIEALFRDLLGWSCREDTDPLYRNYKELEAAEDALKKELLNNPKFKALKRKRETAYVKYSHARSRLREKATSLKRTYQANGITRQLIKDLNQLIGS